MQYSEEVSFEFARRLSAAAQRVSSSFWMSWRAFWLIGGPGSRGTVAASCFLSLDCFIFLGSTGNGLAG